MEGKQRARIRQGFTRELEQGGSYAEGKNEHKRVS